MNQPQFFVSDLLRAVEAFAPRRLAEDWDSVGLQVGRPDAPVRRVMTCLDVTPPILDEAAERGVDALVAHHPLIFKPLDSLNLARPQDALVARLVREGINLVVAHTNLDAAAWGTNSVLAEECGFQPDGPLLPRDEEPQYKLAVFVPKGHEHAVIDAIAGAGGGRIGAYTHCTFRTPGIGTFLGGEGSDPFIGEAGQLEQAAEYRLETIVPESARAAVVRAVLSAHPYEEAAYDLYPLAPTRRTVGLGLIARIDPPVTAAELAADLKGRLAPACVRLSGPAGKKVKRVAVCSGSAGKLIGKVAGRADALVTGEMDYHGGIEAHARGMAVIELGHFETEVLVVRPLAERLAEVERLAGAGVEVIAAENDLQPFEYY